MFSLDQNSVQNLGSIGCDIRKIPDLACDFICVKRLPFSFNLHLFFTKNQGFYDLLNFCNYLNLHQNEMIAYERLKINLSKSVDANTKDEFGIKNYTKRKAAFIKEILAKVNHFSENIL